MLKMIFIRIKYEPVHRHLLRQERLTAAKLNCSGVCRQL